MLPFFTLMHKDDKTRARTGRIETAHGTIETPCFMPVGTQGTVKALDSRDLHDLNAQIILGNTYHLHLRPGEDLIAKAGGLHRFMNWDRPILTDSGGFQVFSLGREHENIKTREHKKVATVSKKNTSHAQRVSIDDNGVTFRSHIDGSTHRFTPESATEIQHKLGADIIMAFDEATPDSADEKYAQEAMNRTHRWAERCLKQHKKEIQNPKSKIQNFLFGIIQGARYRHLREESTRYISSLPFDGIAIGGESIGGDMRATREILEWIMPLIPEEKPHYTMGLGYSPRDLFSVVEMGIDMFDCVAPTRIARNGTLYITPKTRDALGLPHDAFTINITNARFREDQNPIDPFCLAPGLAGYSRSYLHHLFKAEELLAYRLATLHNVHFMLTVAKEIRSAINADSFLELKKQWLI